VVENSSITGAQEQALIEFRRLYLRTLGLALAFSGLVAGLGWVGDELNVGPGLVPIWDPDGRSFWLAGLALVLVSAAVYRWADQTPLKPGVDSASFQPARSAGAFSTNWILPSMTILATVLMLGVYRGLTAILAAGLLTFIGLMAGPIARHLMMAAGESWRERARVMFTLLVHGVAFLALAMIYIHKVRSLFSATAIMIIGLLLLLALSEGEDELFNRRLVYALVGGLMLGQATWGLNYWQAAGWTGGAVLLVCFYLYGGVILTHLRRGVEVRDVVEYGAVSLIAFGIVVYSLFV
jgi:hypothetical protein